MYCQSNGYQDKMHSMALEMSNLCAQQVFHGNDDSKLNTPDKSEMEIMNEVNQIIRYIGDNDDALIAKI